MAEYNSMHHELQILPWDIKIGGILVKLLAVRWEFCQKSTCGGKFTTVPHQQLMPEPPNDVEI
jgi:hypothetical protein